MKAKDVMTRGVVTIDLEATVLQAMRLMLQNQISGLPVVDGGGRIVGMVTEGDFLRRAEIGTERRRPRWFEWLIQPGRRADEYVHSHGRKVAEVMTPEPRTITEDTPLDEVVRLMERHRIKRLPVLRDGRPVGIVSRANLLHALASVVREAKPALSSDEAIRAALLAELQAQKWAPLALINVVVRNGVVDLWGTITSERQRQALIVAAENIPGVKAVKENLAWVEPMSGMVVYDSGEEPVRVAS